MLATFFLSLRQAGIPASLREYLAFLEALEAGLAEYQPEQFYYLARTSLVKDERYLDRFDEVFAHIFKGLKLDLEDFMDILETELPVEWLQKLAEKVLSPEELEKLRGAESFEELMEKLMERLQTQAERHQGGGHWIGTAGTSPFGAWGFNPAGVRIGQGTSRNRSAVKVWEKRNFQNLADDVELGTRQFKVALRRLRRFAREGQPTELDLERTIQSTAEQAGLLHLEMVPERRNAVRILLFVDHGGSMDDHVELCEQLFSAAKGEFGHLESFYFHNCPYENVWRQAEDRFGANTIPTWDLLHTYSSHYRVIFLGDSTMSPWEITAPGASVEHWNAEAGAVWMKRLLDHFPNAAWLNPQPERYWESFPSIQIMKELMEERMFPLTLRGLDEAIQVLN